MIKCPYCGSTAQVKENIPFVSKEGQYVNAKYKCGCGCYFDTENDLDNLLVANKGVLKRLKER